MTLVFGFLPPELGGRGGYNAGIKRLNRTVLGAGRSPAPNTVRYFLSWKAPKVFLKPKSPSNVGARLCLAPTLLGLFAGDFAGEITKALFFKGLLINIPG